MLGECAGVDAGNGGNMVLLKPGVEGFSSSVVAVCGAVFGYDEPCYVDAFAFEVFWQAPLVPGIAGYAIIPYEGIGEDEDLAGEAGVGEAVGISHHAGGEDAFATPHGICAEAGAMEGRAVFEMEGGGG